jgi:hypothetical protein
VLQRSHRYENEIDWRPVQEPGSAVTSDPTTMLPVTNGLEVLLGGPTTIAVGFEATVLDPSAFDAVTRARSRKSTSVRASS